MAIAEDELLSIEETPPEIHIDEPLAAILKRHDAPCSDCEFIGTGVTAGMAAAALGRHRKARHREQWDKEKAEKAETPRKRGRPAKPKVETPPKVRTPAPARPRRVAADEIISLVASGAGTILSYSGLSPAGGMALKLEAPLLGPEIDAAVAHTMVDKRVIQPLVAAKGKFENVGPLVMLPVLCVAIERMPAMRMQLYPALRFAVQPMIFGLVKSMKAQQAEAANVAAAATELANMDPEFAALFSKGGDPIDAIISVLFPVADEPPVDQ